MRTMCLLWLLVAMVGAVASGQTASPATGPSAGAAATSAGLAPVIRAIREANSLTDVLTAFTSAPEADRRNVELNTAYMRRLLQLGYPQPAGLPAATLLALDANSGMAFGVAGFNNGRQNHLPEALVFTTKAANLIRDDNSILNNLGQLVAWYEGVKTYKLPAADQGLLDKVKADCASKPAYATAYKLIKDAYDKQAAAVAQNQQAVTAAEKDLRDAQKTGNDAQQAAKAAEDEAAAHNRRADDLRRQLSNTRLTAAERTRLQTEQRREQVAEEDVKSKKLPPLKKTLQDAVAAVNQKRQALEAAKQKTADTVPLAKLFHWLPPAVDGVVTLPTDSASKPA